MCNGINFLKENVMTLSLNIIQEAIYDELAGDTTLNATVTGIYDDVPDDAVFPYVHLAGVRAQDWTSSSTVGSEAQFELEVFSRSGGHQQALDVMDRIHTLLHGQGLSGGSLHVALVRLLNSTIDTLSDGKTVRGQMRFRVLAHFA